MFHCKSLLWLVFALATTVVPSLSLADGVITVDGNRFLKDGTVWVAEGVTLVGRVSPEKEAKGTWAYARAREKFGPDLLKDVKAYGADLIRFQFSQAGLDPQSSIYDPAYHDEVLDAVRQSRAAGFNVIVSMQWQKPAGTDDEEGMPSPTTNRAWLQIIDEIAQDQGVLLEIFNEPHLSKRNQESWEIWRADMQDLIYLLRGAGSRNVLLVGGIRSALILGGAPDLEDPLDNLGYAVHPYLRKMNKAKQQWDRNFGDFAEKKPVMATEFMTTAIRPSCRATMPQETKALLAYLQKKQIGLTIWAFDLAVVRRGKTLSSFDNFKCGEGEKGGAGEMVHDYYMAN